MEDEHITGDPKFLSSRPASDAGSEDNLDITEKKFHGRYIGNSLLGKLPGLGDVYSCEERGTLIHVACDITSEAYRERLRKEPGIDFENATRILKKRPPNYLKKRPWDEDRKGPDDRNDPWDPGMSWNGTEEEKPLIEIYLQMLREGRYQLAQIAQSCATENPGLVSPPVRNKRHLGATDFNITIPFPEYDEKRRWLGLGKPTSCSSETKDKYYDSVNAAYEKVMDHFEKELKKLNPSRGEDSAQAVDDTQHTGPQWRTGIMGKRPGSDVSEAVQRERKRRDNPGSAEPTLP